MLDKNLDHLLYGLREPCVRLHHSRAASSTTCCGLAHLRHLFRDFCCSLSCGDPKATLQRLRDSFPWKKTVVLLDFVQTTSSSQFGQLVQLFSNARNVVLSDIQYDSFGKPPPPQFGQLVQLFSDVQIQDLKVCLELQILYILCNILHVYILK